MSNKLNKNTKKNLYFGNTFVDYRGTMLFELSNSSNALQVIKKLNDILQTPQGFEDIAYLIDLIDEEGNNNRNYGLGFLACGYDGNQQDEFSKYYLENYGIRVF